MLFTNGSYTLNYLWYTSLLYVIVKYKTTIFHYSQPKQWADKLICFKCIENSHRANECETDSRRRICGVLGIKRSECRTVAFSDHGSDSCSECDMMGNKIKKNEDHIDDLDDDKIGVSVSAMVINATFNNVSAVSWQSALLVEEARLPWENYRHVAIHWTNVIQ